MKNLLWSAVWRNMVYNYLVYYAATFLSVIVYVFFFQENYGILFVLLTLFYLLLLIYSWKITIKQVNKKYEITIDVKNYLLKFIQMYIAIMGVITLVMNLFIIDETSYSDVLSGFGISNNLYEWSLVLIGVQSLLIILMELWASKFWINKLELVKEEKNHKK